MITSTMTAQEINYIFLKDESRLKAFISYKSKSLRRILIKNRKDRVRQCYPYNTANAEYYLIATYMKDGHSTYGWYIYSKETNEFFTRLRLGEIKGVVSFSMHLLKRFAERELKDRDIPIERILLKWSDQLIGTVIYNNVNEFVEACSTGIILGKNDEKRDIMVHKTYVSLDMLKETQMTAWEKVSKYLIALKTVKDKFSINSIEFKVADDILNKDLRLSDSEARTIYSRYFEQC